MTPWNGVMLHLIYIFLQYLYAFLINTLRLKISKLSLQDHCPILTSPPLPILQFRLSRRHCFRSLVIYHGVTASTLPEPHHRRSSTQDVDVKVARTVSDEKNDAMHVEKISSGDGQIPQVVYGNDEAHQKRVVCVPTTSCYCPRFRGAVSAVLRNSVERLISAYSRCWG